MNLATKIICRTVGVAGVGAALYDATRVCGHFANTRSREVQADYLERRYFDSRTLDHVSYRDNAVREKTFDLVTKNPLPAFWGKIKGGFEGLMYSLGNNLIPITCGCFALAANGVMAKIGAAGVALGLCYKVAREGLGLGKKHPMS